MPNERNLNPVQSESEAREMGKKGGIKSGEARRKKKALRETLEAMLKTKLKDEELLEKFEKFGFSPGMDMQDAVCAALIAQAAKGNVKAAVAIIDTIDRKDGETESGGVRVIVEGKVQDLSEGAPDD